MKLTKLKIKNFRGYKEEIAIEEGAERALERTL
mgnify:CR=1 FL=1